MANDYYTPSGWPATNAPGSSAPARQELATIEDAFDKLPTLSGNPNLPAFVNAGGTALIAVSAATARGLLGGTTVGQSIFSLTNPSAVTFLRMNADNTVTALSAADFRTAIGAGVGSVTSVSGTGTVNGVTLTGTVTSSGNITLGGTLAINNADWSGTDLAVTNGGTGASDAATARTNLGLAIASDVQAYSARLTDIAALTATDSNIIVGNGSTWVAESGATARTSLGLTIGSNVQAWDANLDQIAALSVTDNNFIVGNGSAWVAESGATARTSLGGTTVGQSIFTLTNPSAVTFLRMNADNTVTALSDSDFRTAIGAGSGGGSVTSVGGTGTVNGLTLTGTVTTSGNLTLGGTLAINNADWSGTDLAVTNGGTGASDAGTARTNLGVAIGSNVQAWDANLDQIAALAVTDGNIIVGNGSAWVAESGATARTSLGLAIGSDVQAYDVNLDQIAALAVTDGNIIVGNGSAWVAESGATARTSLGVAIGSDVQAYDADTAKLDVAQEWTARQNFNMATLTSSANAVAWNAATSQVAQLDMTENTTISAPSNLQAGSFIFLNVIQGASAYTLAWNAVFKGTIPALPTADDHQMGFSFFSPDGTNCHYCGGTEEIPN